MGKTYALKTFGKTQYNNTVYLNFEQDQSLRSYFLDDLHPERILKFLSLHTNQTITPNSTLLIFDEIQECPEALNSLKYFCEEAPDHHIVAAGSLLGVKTTNTKGFPVGKVTFLQLYPLHFSEFLRAIGEEQLDSFLDEHPLHQPLPDALHDKLITYLKEYLFVGGMPEAVKHYTENRDYDVVREIQSDILAAYERDFAKHAPREQIMKINTVWEQTPQQLAKENKKFIFSHIRTSARGRDYEEAINWLKDAGLVLKSTHIETPRLPLSAYSQANIFKLFLLDVGLLGAQTHLNANTLIKGDKLFTEFKGALTENYVAQELIAQSDMNLHYWSSQGTAEVDFILHVGDAILPLEAKAGVSNKKKSLLSYGEKYKPNRLLRTTLMNQNKNGQIENYPLYMIGRLPKMLDKT